GNRFRGLSSSHRRQARRQCCDKEWHDPGCRRASHFRKDHQETSWALFKRLGLCVQQQNTAWTKTKIKNGRSALKLSGYHSPRLLLPFVALASMTHGKSLNCSVPGELQSQMRLASVILHGQHPRVIKVATGGISMRPRLCTIALPERRRWSARGLRPHR